MAKKKEIEKMQKQVCNLFGPIVAMREEAEKEIKEIGLKEFKRKRDEERNKLADGEFCIALDKDKIKSMTKEERRLYDRAYTKVHYNRGNGNPDDFWKFVKTIYCNKKTFNNTRRNKNGKNK